MLMKYKLCSASNLCKLDSYIFTSIPVTFKCLYKGW